jgi:hypothetical protein
MNIPEIEGRQAQLFQEQWDLEIERPSTDGPRRNAIDARLEIVKQVYAHLEQDRVRQLFRPNR